MENRVELEKLFYLLDATLATLLAPTPMDTSGNWCD